MSLAAQSPSLGQKRLYSDSDLTDNYPSSSKRLRGLVGSSPQRCAKRERRQYSQTTNALATLRSLFPDMDEQVVGKILDNCGDIDEAIRQLTSLRLSQAEAIRNHEPAHDQSPQSLPHPQETSGDVDGIEANEGSEKAESHVKSPTEWIEGLVQQMAEAKDLSDARSRAANELRAFEQAVMKSTNKARQNDLAVMQSKLTELSKENSVLKRAITIQQNRLQEGTNSSKLQAKQAEEIITELQGKVHVLEMSNYSLSMHLKEATSGQLHIPRSHPDVF